MSVTDPTTEPEPQTHDREQDPDGCAHCGTPMVEDQEWCLECGAARTLIHQPPDWRVPVAVIGTVVVLAVAALAVVLINLSSGTTPGVVTRTVVAGATRTSGTQPTPSSRAGQPAKSKPSATKSSTATGATTPTTPTTRTSAATPPGIASWPVGLSEWTVVLARYPDQATANATALRVKAEGLPAGVLSTSDHASLTPGSWLVFTGRYTTHAQALAAAQRLRAQGHSARARRVASTAGQ